MAIIRPFRGYLPLPDQAKEISSPPYDVLSSEEAREIVQSNPKSFLRVIKPEIEFDKDNNFSSERIHAVAKKNLDELIENKQFLRDDKPCFYLYQICMGQHTQTGIVSEVSVQEYDDGLIKKHEHTRPEKENDRTKHIQITKANTGPVFLTFKNDGKFKNLIENITEKKPYISFKAEDHTVHSIWKLESNFIIENIENYFKSINELYIADGHHRAASASRVKKIKQGSNLKHSGEESYNFFLSVIFPHDQIQILGYNRLVNTSHIDQENLMNLISLNFKISELSKGRDPTSKSTVVMYYSGSWYDLAFRKKLSSNNSVSNLSASILQNYLLKPFLKIDDPRTSDKIEFIGGVKGLKELENRCSEQKMIAFVMFPVKMDDLFIVADAGKVMPPKSTWFEPKLRSGVVVRLLD